MSLFRVCVCVLWLRVCVRACYVLIISRQGSPAATSITLAVAAGSDGAYVGMSIYLTGGTGAGQTRVITSYTDSSKVAVVDTWTTNPDGTSTYVIFRTYAGSYVNYGTISGAGSLPLVTLQAASGVTGVAAPATADVYNNYYITIVAGPAVGETKQITAYSSGRVATVSAWTGTPTTSSVYIVYTGGGICTACAAGSFSYAGATV